MKRKAVAVIQARMSSTRLPGKVLMPLMELPVILFMIERVRQARHLDDVIVATSIDPSDDELARTLMSSGVYCHRGNLDDVLDRYHSAAAHVAAARIVRLTGDCPLMDPDLVDTALELMESSGADYVSNVDPPTFPDGLDVEAFTSGALERAWREARGNREREHVTPYLRERKDLFVTASFRGIGDMSALRWTVDYADDLAHVRSLVAETAARSPTEFDRFDLYRICERRRVAAPQAPHTRNEAMQPRPDTAT